MGGGRGGENPTIATVLRINHSAEKGLAHVNVSLLKSTTKWLVVLVAIYIPLELIFRHSKPLNVNTTEC